MLNQNYVNNFYMHASILKNPYIHASDGTL